MPAPINSVRTRVIDTGSGYVAQLSTDNLMWFDLPQAIHAVEDGDDVFGLAKDVALAAGQSMSTGKVVWRSDVK